MPANVLDRVLPAGVNGLLTFDTDEDAITVFRREILGADSYLCSLS
jgi:hypothetical protein